MFPKLNTIQLRRNLQELSLQIVWNLTHSLQTFVTNVSTHCKGKCSMKKIIALAVAFTAITIVAGQEANAQSFSFNNGFQFGAGVGAARGAHLNRGFGFFNPGFGFGTQFNRAFANVQRQVRPPYFAEFPPVYYNGIVRRPYGISPYAAPAGVTPVEMTVAKKGVEPMVVSNPFFKQRENETVRRDNPMSILETGSKEEVKEDAKSTKNKSTRIVNPYFNSERGSIGPILSASYGVNEDN